MSAAQKQLLKDTIDALGVLEEQTKDLKEALVTRGEFILKGKYTAENIEYFGRKLVDIISIAVSARSHLVALGIVTALKKRI